MTWDEIQKEIKLGYKPELLRKNNIKLEEFEDEVIDLSIFNKEK